MAGLAVAGAATAADQAKAAAAPGGFSPSPVVSGEDIRLVIEHRDVVVAGKAAHGFTVNGLTPGPLIRLKEGQRARISVVNQTREDTSIHWHGILLPFQMDGVPGISFPGIKPGETFVYEFPVIQSGTYWYHSHSNLQEAVGLYGAIVVEPRDADPVGHDREHVMLLADWSGMHPHQMAAKLKKMPAYFNWRQQTLGGLLSGKDGMALRDRVEWAKMRMDPSDISDVTGSTYSFLVNGEGPDKAWTGQFKPGERIRMRIVNASGMTIFNVRLPGLPMQVVQADGQNVKPVTVDELQIGVAETYDVIVSPTEDKAYAFVAEAIDRTGLALAALAPRPGMTVEAPPLRKRPVLTMRDMGMDMTGMQGMTMDMSMRNPKNAPGVTLGPGVQTISPMAADRTAEPPLGLKEVGHKVLVYSDLESLDRNPDTRRPTRNMKIHLTGNMERYMWSFDGKKLSEGPDPFRFTQNERVRVTLVNDTMMSHPIHLHGHFFELLGERPGFGARKHTIVVAPGGTATFDLTADAVGDWAFHCHLILHMHAGMFRVVSVRPETSA